MERHFLDTSALVKLYRHEPRTAEVQACIGENDTLVIGGIAALEFRSAFVGLVRQNLISEERALQRITLFRSDLKNFTIVAIAQSLVDAAEALLENFGVTEGLRPADALQLACALEANRLAPLDSVLVTDSILARCALSSGLVVKPNLTTTPR